MAKKIGITETVLRDAHQSLIATRMPIEDMLPILEKLDPVSYTHLDVYKRQQHHCWRPDHISGWNDYHPDF